MKTSMGVGLVDGHGPEFYTFKAQGLSYYWTLERLKNKETLREKPMPR